MKKNCMEKNTFYNLIRYPITDNIDENIVESRLGTNGQIRVSLFIMHELTFSTIRRNLQFTILDIHFKVSE